MQKDFFYEIIKYKPLLFKKIITNYQEQKLIEPLNKTFEGYEFLLKNPRIKEKLLSEQSSFSLDYNWDFTSENKRLALLSKEELSKLALVFGLCLHAKEIAQTLSKDTIQAIKNELSIEMYTFALERGQYRIPYLSEIFSQKNLQFSLLERIKLHGQLCVSFLADSWSEEEKEKLPSLITLQNTDQTHFSSQEIERILSALKKILTTEITKEWLQCLD